MNEKDITEKLQKWMTEFVEVPNLKLGNWPPCPYARQARISNKVGILFSDIADIADTISKSLELLESKEVVVICFDHTLIEATELRQLVEGINKQLMLNNYVILEDHPDATEYVNGVHMNFGECGLLVIQRLDKLNKASEQLKEKGYYDVWSKSELDEVVTWRIR